MLFAVFLLSWTFNLHAAEPEAGASPQYRRSLAVGLASPGLLVRKGFKEHYAVETHFLFGTAGSNDDDMSAFVFGLRGYRYFHTGRRFQFFAGPEVAYVMADNRVSEASGYALGGFAGMEYYLLSRLSLSLDIGPYYIWVKEKSLGSSASGVDFVLNTSLNFYIF